MCIRAHPVMATRHRFCCSPFQKLHHLRQILTPSTALVITSYAIIFHDLDGKLDVGRRLASASLGSLLAGSMVTENQGRDCDCAFGRDEWFAALSSTCVDNLSLSRLTSRTVLASMPVLNKAGRTSNGLNGASSQPVITRRRSMAPYLVSGD